MTPVLQPLRSILAIKQNHTRHLHFHYHHKFNLSTIHKQVDLDGIQPTVVPQQQPQQQVSSSHAAYNPHHGSLPAQVMDAIDKLKISVQVQTHQV